MYVVKRRKIEVRGSLWIISFAAFIALITMVAFSSDLYARSTGQVYQQQESVQKFYEDTFPEGDSMVIPSASDAVSVSVTVLDNLSLSVVDGDPHYATNWPFGATLHTKRVSSNQIAYTVTANY